MAGPLTEALTAVHQELVDAGISAAIDPRDLNLPAIWVAINHVSLDRLSGTGGSVVVELTAIVPDSGSPGTVQDLDDLVEAVNAIYPGRSWDPRAVIVASMSPTPLPALATTIHLDWSN